MSVQLIRCPGDEWHVGANAADFATGRFRSTLAGTWHEVPESSDSSTAACKRVGVLMRRPQTLIERAYLAQLTTMRDKRDQVTKKGVEARQEVPIVSPSN